MKRFTIGARRRWLVVLGVACAVVALVFATTPRSAEPEFYRYIGPPLKDGSRMTFLCPSPVNQFMISPSDNVCRPTVVQDVQIVKPLGVREAILWRLPFWKRQHPTDDLIIGAIVTKIPKVWAKSIVNGRAEQRTVQAVSGGPGTFRKDTVWVSDTRSQLQYQFAYQYVGFSAPSAEFVKHEETITKSFQVLPPGAAVPIP